MTGILWVPFGRLDLWQVSMPSVGSWGGKSQLSDYGSSWHYGELVFGVNKNQIKRWVSVVGSVTNIVE